LNVKINVTMGSYSRLSSFMTEEPETYVFRTFNKLNVKNILYYQAELAHLEQELEEIEHADATCGISPRQDYARRWKKLQAGIELSDLDQQPNTQGAELQWQTFKKIRRVLEKYSKCLLVVDGLFIAKPRMKTRLLVCKHS
jgi:hypothetical protein